MAILTDKSSNSWVQRGGPADGDFIDGDEMAAYLDQLGERTNYLYALGICPYNPALTYTAGAFCQDNGTVYRAQVGNVGKPPASNPSFWVKCPMTKDEIIADVNLGSYATTAQMNTGLSSKQNTDATLTALANLITAANQIPYATGADEFAMTALTPFARTLLDDVNAAGALATLGAAPLDSPALTGIPTAPTAATGTDTTQIATTAFVNAEIAADRPFEATVANIKMDGAQSVGAANTVARGDHVHPTDTSRVAKTGDTMTGALKTRYTSDWVGFSADNPTEGKSTFFDGQVAGVPRGGMQIKPAAGGNGEYFTTIAATPAGATNADRRVGGLDVYAGGLYAYAYGWLHDYFLKRSDCITNWYPSHYAGAQTFKIRNLNLMITTMRVDALGADTTLNLPEAYTGVAHVIGSDAWSGKNVVASCMVSGTQIRVFAGPSTNCTFMIIGFKNNI